MNHSIIAIKSIVGKSKIKRTLINMCLLGFLGSATLPVMAADADKGKALHEAKCGGCHDTRQYTRKNRIVHTFDDLQGRVEFCDAASNAGFSPDDIDNVVAYLNRDFYKFKQ